jgi:hypothetical protein
MRRRKRHSVDDGRGVRLSPGEERRGRLGTDTVEGARPRPSAIARKDSPAARPLEICSRSATLRCRSLTTRARGRTPPVSPTSLRSEALLRPSLRAIRLTGSSRLRHVPDLLLLFVCEPPHRTPWSTTVFANLGRCCVDRLNSDRICVTSGCPGPGASRDPGDEHGRESARNE